MRILRSRVTAFRCIEEAEVELGPGLNVLYGPNELGKSTLVNAIRAALLLPTSSTEAEGFRSWFGDEDPTVEVVFQDDDAKVWRVAKAFRRGANATLDFSKDGRVFQSDCSGREVEERLRGILGWGIPVPGGKGGPKGLPTSFLTQVLLAEQTDVLEVLNATLDTDLEESGRQRLTKVLKGLAQDPVFKRILDEAQVQAETFFTPVGKRKGGKGSPFALAANEVKDVARRLDEKRAQLEESQSAESALRAASERAQDLQESKREAGAQLEMARAGYERRQQLERAAEAVSQAKEQVEKIRAERGRVQKQSSEMDRLRAEVERAEAAVTKLAAAATQAGAALREAEEAHRRATSEDAARERELRQTKLEKEQAKVESERKEWIERRDRAKAALEAEQLLANALAEHARAKARMDESRKKCEAEAEVRVGDEAALKQADAIVAFGRWRVAAEAIESARRARDDASSFRAQSSKLQEAALEKTAAAESLVVPSNDDLKRMADLQRRRDLAEAGLGGGLSFSLRLRRPLALTARVDGSENRRTPSTEPLELEASRSIDLSIDDLLDLTATAGAPAARREAEVLQAEWKAKISPALERAHVATMQELQELAASRASLLSDGEKLRQEAATHDSRAANAEAKAFEHEAAGSEADIREGALQGHDREELRREFERLGSKDAAAEQNQRAKRAALDARSTVQAKAEATAASAEADLRNAAEKCREAEAVSSERMRMVSAEDPSALLDRAANALADMAARSISLAADLETITAQGSANIEAAEKQRAQAVASAELAQAAHSQGIERRNKAANDLALASGELKILREAAERNDEQAALELLRSREADRDAVMASGALATADDVTQKERALREVTAKAQDAGQQFHQAEGALKHVGGAALREEIAELEKVRERAEEREREVETKAEAWLLLREALRESENLEGAHLGRALAQPVGDRFAALTRNRYRTLSLGPALETQGIAMDEVPAEPDDVLQALSRGTKEQLATLIRLTIAEHLQSAIVLDDHLVQTDPERLTWFQEVLRQAALKTQVIVLTCHPEAYVAAADLPAAQDQAMRDLAAGALRVIDLGRIVRRNGPKD